jgi:hypothetical protein
MMARMKIQIKNGQKEELQDITIPRVHDPATRQRAGGFA